MKTLNSAGLKTLPSETNNLPQGLYRDLLLSHLSQVRVFQSILQCGFLMISN